jgi:pimeloyl-ACP methyl ester carboxylesterase
VQPETTYAPLGEDRVAYQVLGEGPDLVLTMGAFGHVDLLWEDPGVALFLRRLASFSRLISFDRRGTGASDPYPENVPPPWEAYADEVAAVMDAAGSREAALMATTAEAGPMALFFAATRPERTRALVLANASARFVADDDYPIGFSPEQADTLISRVEESWGTAERIADGIPSRAGDERFRRWMARVQRSIASPRTVHIFLRALFEVDVRPLLPLLQVHDDLGARLVEQWGGRVVKTTGDGLLATFDGPGRAIACAVALRDRLGDIDVQIRAGLHAGEVELRDDDVGGIAVHIAARIMAAAGPGEVLVPSTVRDLVAGSDHRLEDRGTRQLKGVEGDWQLFAVPAAGG